MYGIVNNKLMKSPVISAFDRGFLLGDGVFETLRVVNDKILFFDEHYNRLKDSLSFIEINIKLNKLKLKQNIIFLVKKNKLKDAKVRLSISRGISNIGLSMKNSKPSIIILCEKNKLLNQANVVTYERIRQFPRIKALSNLQSVMAKRHADENNADESIFVKHNLIGEGSYTNIFIVKDNIVITSYKNILNGITRQKVINLCKENKMKIQEKSIKVNELLNCDEAFLTCTTQGIIPIVSINKRVKNIGKITQLLIKLYGELIE